MKYLLIIIATVFTGLTSLSSYAEDYNFKPGLWETTSTSEIKGIPEAMASMMKIPPQKDQDCIRENDPVFESDNECKYNKKRISANKMLLNVSCTTPEGETKGNGEINFNGKKTSGWFEMKIPQGPSGPMTMKNIFTAKYIGECK